MYLCSPETAIAAAIAGEITDPRKLGKLPALSIPKIFDYKPNFVFPKKNDSKTEIERGPNIKPLPEFTPLHQEINCSVVIKLKDNISTDDILPAGAKILPLRSNIPAISEYTLTRVDETFPKRAKEVKCGMIVAGDNYGQGSSREHAAITLRYLGIAVVLAKSFARIHRSNLINFGVLPVTFKNADDYEKISQLDDIQIENVIEFIKHKKPLILKNRAVNMAIEAVYNFDKRDTEMLLAGGLLPMIRNKNK